ncbi:hypothetical protein [Chamaesiphon sp. VAR_69_metabat_338]|uniref:hypothetical protein n=1 Tax=Chamaesiphon sp. VAR_69_metabat_338 TaxID=2964704 RepID=UPI00286E162F|nr:hypothetical protein [Chamaesiphon sp. VAR_69_metabat_338]
MPKSTTAIALFCICLITLVSIVSVCKISGISIPFMAELPSWEWLKLAIELCSILG